MADVEIVIEFPESDTPAGRLVLSDASPREKDLLYAGMRARDRIFTRTLAGKDFEGRPFAPYLAKGPVYWYPRQGAPRAARVAAVKRYARITGGKITRSRLGLKFANYAALKAALGRDAGLVDLYGAGPGPHMLNALTARVEGNAIVIGIFSEAEAARADAHNEGRGHMPRRRFLDVSRDELEQIGEDVAESMGKS